MSHRKVGYTITSWKPARDSFVRLEEHARAFMALSALKFRAIELSAGSGRWDNLGSPETIRLNYGSPESFLTKLNSCGVDAVTGMTWDPSAPVAEEDFQQRSTSNPRHHSAVTAASLRYLDLLAELRATHLIVRATESAWKVGADYDASAVADLLNLLGEAARERGVRVAARIDCLSPARGAEEIGSLMSRTEPALVDLSVSTADLAISEVDAPDVIRQFGPRVGHVHLADARRTDSDLSYLASHAELELIRGGSAPFVERWYWELGAENGLVAFDEVDTALAEVNFAGWTIVNGHNSPNAAETAMLNSWYLARRGVLPR